MFSRGEIVVLFVALTLLFALGTIGSGAVENKYNENNVHQIYYCDAPFGRYWTDEHGVFVFVFGILDSELDESYTIKYIDNSTGELKTVILDSTSQNVHLKLSTNWINGSIPELKIVWTCDFMVFGHSDYYLTLPDPKAMGAT